MIVLRRHKLFAIYTVAIVTFGAGLFIWVGQGNKTKETTEDTNVKVEAAAITIEDLKKAVEDLQEDHDGQDALAVCLGKLIIASQRRMVTDVEIETCVITTAVPARQTSEDTEPSNQGGASSQSQGSPVSSSSSQNTPNNDNQQPEIPQNPPDEPDPPQSIIPFVEEPIIGCPLGRLCL